MPRNVKDSDDETETKSGRRTRAAINSSVLDSPLRRSSRIKQPTHAENQEGSSPESVSDVSSVGATRSNRRRTTTGDSARSLRTRRNSAASDISELTETESLTDGPAKRITRRSVAGVSAADTPPNLNGRTRRTTRAGSESKSTPPVGRTTRRNRASSLEPEGIEEKKNRETGTPVKSRKRASVMPSEPAVAEESEDSGRRSRRVDKTVYEIDENESETSAHDTSKSSRRKSKSDANESVEKMEVDESPVGKSEGNTIERSTRENTEAGADASHVSKKLEGSFKVADSPETKKADVASPQQISSPQKGASYTIENILSPSTEKQDRSPGNKENEILNDSAAALLEKTAKVTSIDVRLMGRKSLNSSYVKTPEKRHNISVDDIHLSNTYETSTKSQADSNTESTKKLPEKINRKERYSVDDCVVVIEPMEIDRLDKIAAAKVSKTPETSTRRKSYEIVELPDEATETRETDKSSDKDVENVIIDDDVTDEESDLKISNILSIATKENKTEKQEVIEIMEVNEDDETTETLHLETKDTSVIIEEKTPSEGVNDEKVSPEPSDISTEPQILISDQKAPNDDANAEKISTEPSVSIAASPASNSEKTAPRKGVDDEKTSPEPSVSIAASPASNSENEAPSKDADDKKTSPEPSVLIAASPASNLEDEAPSEGVNDENTSANTSVSDGKLRNADSDEKSLTNDENDEKMSTESSTSNTEFRAPNVEEKTSSEGTNDEDASADPSDSNVELVASNTSINNEKPINSDEIEDNSVFAKGRKSSIVTESPTSGANGEEASNVSEEPKRRESTSNGRSSNAGDRKNKSDEKEAKSPEKKIEDERKARQSDEESEYEGYPAFKDIPASEWTGAEDGESNKVETSSLHSVSTERNESECDFELVDKGASQNTEKEEEVISDYDSDATVKIAVATRKSPEEKDEDEEESVLNSETPMELSSDGEEEEEIETKANKEISKKKTSLDSSRKINETNTPNKNISLITETSAKGSPISLNDSRCKSLLSVDDKSNDSSNSSMKLNSSVNNSLKKRSLGRKADDDSENEEESDNAQVKTPKTVVRKSLDASGKKFKDRTLDTSNTSHSAKNTPSNAEKRGDQMSTKSKRSPSKLALSSQSDDADDSLDKETESELSQDDNKAEKLPKSPMLALRKQLRGRLSTGSTADFFSSVSDSPASPKIEKKRLNKPAYIGSAKQLLNEKNFTELCDSDSEYGGSQKDTSISEIPHNTSAKSASAKKSKANKDNSKIAQGSDFEGEVFKDSPASPDPEEKINEKSVKIGSAKKSANKKVVSVTSSDSIANDEEAQENFNKSVKSGSAKKSKVNKNNSKIAQSSDSEAEDFKDSPTSPDPEEEINAKSAKIGSAIKSANKNNSKLASANSDSEDNPASPDPEDEVMEKSVKIGSAKKSANKNNSKLASANSDSEDNPASPDPEDEVMEKSVKIGSAKKSANKNNSKLASANSDSEDNPASPDPEDEVIAKSVKIGSAIKSANKNNSKLAYESLESEDDDENSQEKAKKSVKIESARKSKNNSIVSVTSSNSMADDEEAQENFGKSSKSASAKKSAVDKNYSTIAQVNSDSDVDEDVESDSSDDADISRKIPAFLFGHSSDDEDSEKSIDSDIARELNLDGRTSLVYSDDNVPADDCMATESESSDEDDDGSDLIDFVVDDDEENEFEDVEKDLGLDDDSNDSSADERSKPRKRIINRPADASDTDESDVEEPMNVSYTIEKSVTVKTPIKASKLNKTQELVEPDEKSADLNLSVKNIATKTKNLLIQSSTPKTLARKSLLLENSNSAKATTPANKSLSNADSSTKLEVSSSRKLSKSVCEAIDTPTKLGSSFKLAKTPKMSLSVQQQLQTSLPADLNDSLCRTNLSKLKSTKISTLNQTVAPPEIGSPETRFLMKEKLNDSMPALKLQQRAKALRRSVLENLREEIHATDEALAEIEKATEERVAASPPSKEEAAIGPETSGEKKKKKKKKKNRENANASETSREEIATSFIENVAEVDEGTSAKKSKKVNKKKKTTEIEPEDTKAEEIPTKKKKKKLVEIAEQSEPEEPEKKKKKKKDRKAAETTEPEVPSSRQKSRRIAKRNVEKSDSDDAPETVDFAKARDAALRDLRKLTESVKAGQEAKKKKHQENLSSKHERKTKTRSEATESLQKVKTSVKRLPDDLLHNLSDVVERPKKKRKVVKEENTAPSKVIGPLHTTSGDFNVYDGYIPLSSTGGTTQFAVVNLKKAVKRSKKNVAAMTFRERMLARNPRQPISAYLMYLQKQKAFGKDKL